MKTLNERDSFELWKQVSLKGKGCNAETFPESWKDKCDGTSISHADAKRKRTHTSVKKEEFSAR